jgi:ubiquinone/menaquinone biosynthesis C-methylase UbiE
MQPAQVWQLGDYATVGDRWAQAGEGLVRRLVRPGHRVLDIATGPGGMAIAAAEAGADATGLDVAPSLLAQARARAAAAGSTYVGSRRT